MIHTTAIAMSGGVDSLMAANLLINQGHNVIGIHFLTGYDPELSGPPSEKNAVDLKVAQLGKLLGIPVHIIDLSSEFRVNVIDYFKASYLSGQTPNPCLVCNPLIKFGTLLDYALKLGASRLATGHYARIEKDTENKPHLLKGFDPNKDQSYFLAFLTRYQLDHIIFPLGKLTKAEVKALAKENGLSPVTSGESQDICFIRNKTYTDFLLEQPDFKQNPGEIIDSKGRNIGTHTGLFQFTTGQRRGINCPASKPYYVLRLDIKKNRLIVGEREELLSSECKVKNVNWISGQQRFPIKAYTKVRYRHKAVLSELHLTGKNNLLVRFNDPEPAITPGQGAVFYNGNEVLGGGWIDGAE